MGNAATTEMNTPDPSGQDSRPALDRRRVLHRFGLAAAGLALGPYVAPAVASMRPPATFVGSPYVEFWQEYRSPYACDGPAARVPAVYIYSVNSIGFEGKVRLEAHPLGPTSGWTVDISPKILHVQHGAHAIIRLVMDCFGGQVGASPQMLSVLATATATPIGSDKAFVIGTNEARAECVFSTIQLVPPNVEGTIEGGAVFSVDLELDAAWVDSRFVGPVQLYSSPVPHGWHVMLGHTSVEFQMGGKVKIPVHVKAPHAGHGAPEATITVFATVNGPGFSEPMLTGSKIHLQVI